MSTTHTHTLKHVEMQHARVYTVITQFQGLEDVDQFQYVWSVFIHRSAHRTGDVEPMLRLALGCTGFHPGPRNPSVLAGCLAHCCRRANHAPLGLEYHCRVCGMSW